MCGSLYHRVILCSGCVCMCVVDRVPVCPRSSRCVYLSTRRAFASFCHVGCISTCVCTYLHSYKRIRGHTDPHTHKQATWQKEKGQMWHPVITPLPPPPSPCPAPCTARLSASRTASYSPPTTAKSFPTPGSARGARTGTSPKVASTVSKDQTTNR